MTQYTLLLTEDIRLFEKFQLTRIQYTRVYNPR